MTFHTTTMEVGRAVSDAFAKVERDTMHVDLVVVLQFVAIGLLLTAIFFAAGSLSELGQILAVSG
jgi:hypothetical protein